MAGASHSAGRCEQGRLVCGRSIAWMMPDRDECSRLFVISLFDVIVVFTCIYYSCTIQALAYMHAS